MKEAALILMAVVGPLGLGQTAESPLLAWEPVKPPLGHHFLSSLILCSLPHERESLSVAVGVPRADADLQRQAPVGERPLGVPAISPLSPEQIADSPLLALENVKPFLASSSLPDSALKPLQQQRGVELHRWS